MTIFGRQREVLPNISGLPIVLSGCFILAVASTAFARAGHGGDATNSAATTNVVVPFNPSAYSNAIIGLTSANWQISDNAQSAANKAFAEQMRKLTGVKGAEQRSQIVRALEFQKALVHFAFNVRFMPMAEKIALAKFWLRQKRVSILAEVLSGDTHQNVKGLQGVDSIPGWQADVVLSWQLPRLGSSNPLILSAVFNALAKRPSDFGMVKTHVTWPDIPWAFHSLGQENNAIMAIKKYCMTHRSGRGHVKNKMCLR